MLRTATAVRKCCIQDEETKTRAFTRGSLDNYSLPIIAVLDLGASDVIIPIILLTSRVGEEQWGKREVDYLASLQWVEGGSVETSTPVGLGQTPVGSLSPSRLRDGKRMLSRNRSLYE